MVSSGLVKMASTAQKTSAAIKGANGTLSQSYEEIKNKIGQLESAIGKSKSLSYIREARRELEQLQKIAVRAPGNTDKGGGGGGLLAMARNLIGPLAIAGGVAGVFGAGAKAEQDLVGLRTFLGKGAEQAYANIKSDAAATPFDTAGLLMVNRSLITAGVSAEAARKDTLNLANAVAAVGGGNEELTRMAVNLQQIKNTGKASGVDIKQFAYAGINIYAALAAATGKSTAEVKEMDVTYELLSYALDKAAKTGGIFAGALANQAKTVSGRYGTMIDTIKIGAADAGTALQPLMHGLLDIGMGLVNTIIPAFINSVNWIKENSTWLGFLATGLIAAAAGYWLVIGAMNAGTIATILWTGAQWLLNTAMSLNPIGLVVAAIAALVAGVIYAWNKFEGFRAVLYGVWEVAKMLADVYLGLGKILIGAITFNPLLMKEGVSQLVSVASDVANGGIAKKFNIGYGKGVASFAADNAATPSSSTVSSAFAAGGLQIDDIGKDVTSGGPRVININGVKFAETIEINSQTIGEGFEQLEPKLKEMFLRLLNSGAAVAG